MCPYRVRVKPVVCKNAIDHFMRRSQSSIGDIAKAIGLVCETDEAKRNALGFRTRMGKVTNISFSSIARRSNGVFWLIWFLVGCTEEGRDDLGMSYFFQCMTIGYSESLKS